MSDATQAERQSAFRYGDPAGTLFRHDPADRELFDRKLREWMPPGCFDAHAHLYDLRMLVPGSSDTSFAGAPEVGYATYLEHQRAWLGDRCPTGGLFFPFPVKHLDTGAANRFLSEELRIHVQCSHHAPRDEPPPRNPRCSQLRGLMMVTPADDPADVEAQITRDHWAGFKVYHVFASGPVVKSLRNSEPRPNTLHAETSEFLPEWAWEIADRHGLVIMLHMVLDRALADRRNQEYIRNHCISYPTARLILAHAARGFCAAHTVEGIDALRGLSNVWFDTSAICEPTAFEAILRAFGSTRLMYGSDFPVSELRAHAMSLGDGFWWLYEDQVDWSQWKLGRPVKVGIQSLLALQQACRTLGLRDREVERIFSENARSVIPDAGERRPDPSADADGASEVVSVQSRTRTLYVDAKRIIPGGTQLLSKRPEQFAPDQWPAYFSEAHGCEVVDLDGGRYLDFSHNAVGACLLGYAHPAVTAAVVRRATLGSTCTLNSPDEVELARALVRLHPWAHCVRFARGGGESLAVAARIVRAATRRDVIAICGYHGWSDWYLAANLHADHALDGHLLPGLSPVGVPRGLQGTTLPFTYNKLDEFRTLVAEHGPRLAAVIMEPTRHTPPAAGFLVGIRELCDRSGAKLVFDEVTTGFRFRRGGVHLDYGIEPDVAVFAKALGSGYPIGAIIGKAETMQAAQDTFISSTSWSEGLGFAAALATLDVMDTVDVPNHVQRIAESFRTGCMKLARIRHLPLNVGGYPALTTLSFDHPDSAALLTLMTVRMLNRGYLAGAGFYPTLAHQEHHVDAFLAAADEVFRELAESIRTGDTVKRIGGAVKQSGFARLT